LGQEWIGEYSSISFCRESLVVYVNEHDIVPPILGTTSSYSHGWRRRRILVDAATDKLSCSINGAVFAVFASAGAGKVPVLQSCASVEQRVADLVSRMTLEEKIAQLGGNWQNRDIEHDETLRCTASKLLSERDEEAGKPRRIQSDTSGTQDGGSNVEPSTIQWELQRLDWKFWRRGGDSNP
jgi:hypothetical protein